MERKLEKKKAGEDLALCWKYCVESCLDEMTAQEGGKDNKKIEAIYRGGDQISKLHPEPLAKYIQLWDESRIETFLESKKKCKYGDEITSLVKSVHLLGLARKNDCAAPNPAPIINWSLTRPFLISYPSRNQSLAFDGQETTKQDVVCDSQTARLHGSGTLPPACPPPPTPGVSRYPRCPGHC